MSLILLNPRRFKDDRGWFTESWNRTREAVLGIDNDFCQDNHSYTARAGTLRGIHFQRPPHAQAKLVRCIKGRIFDVAVDLRRGSPTFGKWRGVVLCSDGGQQLFLPEGYGHAFLTLEDDCEVVYKIDSPYSPEADSGIIWNDPAIAIDWPGLAHAVPPILSAKDAGLGRLELVDCVFAYDGNPMTLNESSQ